MNNKKIKAELYRLGELPEGWENDIDRDAIDGDVAEILQSDQEILGKYKPSAMAREIEKKAGADRGETRKKTVRSAVAYMTAAAAIAVLGLIVPGMLTGPAGFDPSDLTRVKGSSQTELTVYRNTGAITEILNEESLARKGDLIQLGYSVSAEMPYGIILSVDGRGVVTRHLAPEGDLSEILTPGGEHLLDFAYELDDAPRFETFYLLVSDRPFPVDPVIDLLSREARGDEEILDIPEIIRKSSIDTRGIGKMLQYAVSIPKEE